MQECVVSPLGILSSQGMVSKAEYFQSLETATDCTEHQAATPPAVSPGPSCLVADLAEDSLANPKSQPAAKLRSLQSYVLGTLTHAGGKKTHCGQQRVLNAQFPI